MSEPTTLQSVSQIKEKAQEEQPGTYELNRHNKLQFVVKEQADDSDFEAPPLEVVVQYDGEQVMFYKPPFNAITHNDDFELEGHIDVIVNQDASSYHETLEKYEQTY